MHAFIKLYFLFLVLIFAQSVFAVQMTSLNLRVVDQNGDLVPNVKVELKFGEEILKAVTIKEGKEIVLSKLQTGKYTLEVEANGFRKFSQEVEIKSGKNNLVVNLEISGIVESVKIERDAQEKSVDEAFNGFFTRDQISALPNDPEEIERELKRRFGEDIIIRVDGFGGRIPNKSQIASIRYSLSSFDAENHELGSTYVDIITKVGAESFSGNIGFRFNNESLNARTPLSPIRLPEQTRGFDFFLVGPLQKNKSSFWLAADTDRLLNTENILAHLPSGVVANSTISQTTSSSIAGNIFHNLVKQHVARMYFSYWREDFKNLGVGSFNLAERAFSKNFNQYDIDIAESGYIGKRFLNTIQFEFTSEFTKVIPQNESSTVIVLDAFSAGGAGNASQNVRQTLGFADNLLWGYKRHSLKIGGLVWFEKRNETSSVNQNGTFLFSSLEDFQAQEPSLFTQNRGIRDSKVKQFQVGVYLQDDFRIRKNLGLSFGLRYEWQNNLRDYNNFSPRIGITWSPLKSGKATLRGGVGLFYNWLDTGISSFIASRSIDQPSEIVIVDPNFSNPLQDATNQTFPRSFWQKDEDLRNPYVIHTSIGVESALRKNLSFRAEYFFQKGVHQFRSRNKNAPRAGVRPDPNFGNIIQVESSAYFVRNSLKLALTGSFSNYISYGINYSLAKKTSDNDGVFELPSDNNNLKSDISAANDDQRNRFYTYLGWTIKKGMRLAASYTANSPTPYSITTGNDDNGDTIFNDRPPGFSRNSERGNWRSQMDAEFSWFFSFLNRKERFDGNLSASINSDQISPGIDMTDRGKRFGAKIYIRGRNILNQTNFNAFSGVQTSPFFRQPIAADNPRRIEIGLGLSF